MKVRPRKLSLLLTLVVLTMAALCYDGVAIASSNRFEPFRVDSCDAETVLQSKSRHYAGLGNAKVTAKAHYEKFSESFTKDYNIRAQGITKYTGVRGQRVYELDPIIFFEPYEGTRSHVRSEMRKGIAKGYWPGRARYGYRYYWEKGAFKKNRSTGLYFVDPTKFKVYLSFHVRVPEWRQDETETSAKDRKYWNRYICGLYAHERKHVEITRGHMLESIDATLTLKAQSSAQLETLVRKEWEYQKSELRIKQKAFDKRTNHGRNPD